MTLFYQHYDSTVYIVEQLVCPVLDRLQHGQIFDHNKQQIFSNSPLYHRDYFGNLVSVYARNLKNNKFYWLDIKKSIVKHTGIIDFA